MWEVIRVYGNSKLTTATMQWATFQPKECVERLYFPSMSKKYIVAEFTRSRLYMTSIALPFGYESLVTAQAKSFANLSLIQKFVIHQIDPILSIKQAARCDEKSNFI